MQKDKFKKNYKIISALFLVLMILYNISCDKENEPETAEITPSTWELFFSKSGETKTLSIKSNVTLEVKSNNESWCHVAPASSTSSTVLKYEVTVDANSDTNNRTTTISIKGGNISESVNVTQAAADGLIVPQTSFDDISGEGTTIDVIYRSNGAVSVVCNDNWISQTETRSSMEEQIMSFYIERNYSTARTGTITFTLGNITETVTVNQLSSAISNIGMNSDAIELASKIYAGWNIGNTLEAIGGETAWGNPKITEKYIREIKKLGFNAIRIPCAWDQYIENNETYKIKDSWLDRVNEVVAYCISNDMYAIVNIHWDGGWLEENCTPDKQEINNQKQHALWTQIAQRLNHYDERLLFAGTNEPNVNNATNMTVLKSYLQTFIDAVRETGGNNALRNLIVQGPNTDIEMTDKLFGDMPSDVVANRLMAEVHYYNPWSFCGLTKDETWGKMAYFWGDYKVSGSDRNTSSGDINEMKTLFNKMKTNFVDKGIPVILGEYGAITIRSGLGANQEAHDKSRELYDETVTREAKNHGMVPFYWETGRVINRNNGEIKDNYAINGILKGAASGNYPF